MGKIYHHPTTRIIPWILHINTNISRCWIIHWILHINTNISRCWIQRYSKQLNNTNDPNLQCNTKFNHLTNNSTNKVSKVYYFNDTKIKRSYNIYKLIILHRYICRSGIVNHGYNLTYLFGTFRVYYHYLNKNFRVEKKGNQSLLIFFLSFEYGGIA